VRHWRRHGNLIDKARPQLLYGSNRRQIICIARNRYSVVESANKRRNCQARLPRQPTTSESFIDSKSDVPSELPDMLRVTDSEIDMPNTRIIGQANAEVVIRDEIACRVAGHNVIEVKPHLAEAQTIGRVWQRAPLRHDRHINSRMAASPPSENRLYVRSPIVNAPSQMI
jgi:hypothetical protein